ncbi:hypothetical protein DRJ48_01240 [Candidatus Woesearchaeota archaeon]|nr:glycosyltransferase [Candidatus Woesearchaeota archaeon]RLE43331.1 MAG: hypothetical protein DRJ48_01240 [Candidatus Woesearchaeota archaeon]
MNVAIKVLLFTLYLGLLYSLVFFFLTFLEKTGIFKKENKRKVIHLKHYPMVTIAVPAHNEEQGVYSTLASLTRLDYPKDRMEIIVVNDGSTDNTEAEVKRAIKDFPELKIILINQRNMGKGAALNKALEIATGELFACLDADSVVEPKTLKKMVYMFNTGGKELALVTPAMKVKEPRNILQRLQRTEYIISILLQRLLARMDSIYVAPGPFSVYRTSIIRKHGGFDHTSITEDQEIAYRMQYHNYKIAHCHDGYVYTECPKNVFKLFRQRNRWYRGSLINLLKYRRMMLNKSYGHFGVFQMPLNLFSFFLGAGSVFFFVYFFIRPLARQVRNLYLTDFDIATWLKDFRFNFNILDLNVNILFVVAALFVFSLVVMFIAHRNAREGLGHRGFISLLAYFLVYYLLLGLFCCLAIIELGLGKKQKW